MTDPNRWYFVREKIQNSPSRRCGMDEDKEILYRQHAANFIQDLGQKLQVNQLCINTATVYMHRFYMFHSFTKFHRNAIAACALFLAAKVEEQPRKLEHVIKIAHWCLNQRPNKQGAQVDTKSPEYMRQANELVMNENIMLQTLGFEIGIDHPHTSVVKCCQLVKAPKDLAQRSYHLATNSLQITTMCLQYKPTVVACFCIHVACKWANWKIPASNEGKSWFYYVDETVTLEMLESLTAEYLCVFEKFEERRKKKNEIRNTPFDHHAMYSLAPNNDKKLSASTQSNDPDKQRSSSAKPNERTNSDSTQQQPSNSINKLLPPQSSRIQSDMSNNNNLISNGPFKEMKKERMLDQIDRPLVNRQYDNNKSKDMYYNQFNRIDKKESLPVDKKAQIKPDFNKDYNKPSIPTSSSSSSSTSIHKPTYDTSKSSSHQSSSLSSISKGYSSTELNDKNNNRNLNMNPNVNQKPPTKQQQIQLEKQRQQDERNRIKPKNQDYLWDSSNKQMNTIKPNNNQTSSTNVSFINNNSSSTNSSSNNINHSFFDNLIHNPSMYNSNSNSSNDNNSLSKSPGINWGDMIQPCSNSNEDSFDPKKDMNSDLKMEFSDNDSNQSGVNLPSIFMNDAINGQIDNSTATANTTKPATTSSAAAKSSFMSIFKNDDTAAGKNNTNSTLRSSITNNLSGLPGNHQQLVSQQPPTNLSSSNSQIHNNQSSINSTANISTSLSNSIGVPPAPTHQQTPTLLPPLSSQPFSIQSTLTGAYNSSSLINFTPQPNLNQSINSAINSTPLNSTLNSSNNSIKSNSTDHLLSHNHQLYNSYSTLPSSMGSSLTNSFNSSGLDPFIQPASLTLGDSYHKSSSSSKSKSKDKDKDRESKHHKKHKSKDKHKKHKSKDKDRSSSKHKMPEEQTKLPSSIKLIIKKGGNEKAEDNANGEKAVEKLKLVIPMKSILSSTGASSSDRKRKQSPKDSKDKRIKTERD